MIEIDRTVYERIDPSAYPDWNERALALPSACIFHTINWMRVVQEAYGHQPYYFGSFEGKHLSALLPFLEVKSRITGIRGVSLPSSDYCEPIIADNTSYLEAMDRVTQLARKRQWKYLEIRGGDAMLEGISPYTSYHRHVLNLQGKEDAVFAGMRSNYRAKIRKASKNDLKVAILQSPDAMAEYYRLHCLTRQHHGLPPQPGIFFKKIYEHIIAQNLGFVTLVSQQGRYIAGAVFFCFGKRAVYKFGASEVRYQHLYPNYLLFWEAIHWLCRHGYRELCFGRTDVGQEGLIHFKEGWGASNIPLNYYRYDPKTCSFLENASKRTSILMDLGINVCKKMPLTLLRCAGTLLYPHMD